MENRKSNPDNGSGVTDSERFLFAQCQHSYLQFWSYANLFRDQGRLGDGDGKELCDVMAVLGNAIILFSDKSCIFPQTGNLAVDWMRWEKRAIIASRKQLRGAERWIKEYPDRIFLDRKCTQPLPIALPLGKDLKIYKVAVALGASERFRREIGGSGSLFLDALPHCNPSHPFVVSLVNPQGELIHILDDITLPVLLNELDTLPDLLEYLDTKETLIRRGSICSIAGEEEMIGLFLGLRAGMTKLELPEDCHAIIAEGIYADIIQRPPYRNYKNANQVSYFWDDLIRYHSACTLSGTLIPGSPVTIQENEAILRLLAAEPRISRRMLSMAFLGLHKSAPRDRVTSRTIKGVSETVFVFQIHPAPPTETADERKWRMEELHGYCFLTAWRNREARNIVGICNNGGAIGKSGFDVLGLEILGWGEEGIKAGQHFSDLHDKDVIDPMDWRKVTNSYTRAWDPTSDLSLQPRRKDDRKKRRSKRKQERRRRRQ